MDVDALLTDRIDALIVWVRSVDEENYPTPLGRGYTVCGRSVRPPPTRPVLLSPSRSTPVLPGEKIGRALGVSPQAAHQKYAAAQNPDPRVQ